MLGMKQGLVHFRRRRMKRHTRRKLGRLCYPWVRVARAYHVYVYQLTRIEATGVARQAGDGGAEAIFAL